MQNIIPIIDPHIHLFDLAQGQYNWLRLENPPHWPDKHIICRDFNENHLNLPAPFSLKGFVHIEAGFDNEQPWREVDWLEATCKLPFRTVAYADITSDDFSTALNKLKQRQTVVGIRHILEEDAESILSHNNTLKNLTLLANAGLSFDAQLHLNNRRVIHRLISISQQIDDFKLIICHAGLPLLQDSLDDNCAWTEAIETLAELPQVAIKASGWEMQNRSWQYQVIAPYIQHILQCFGEDRVMFASNFPLSLWRKPYAAFWRLCSESLPPEILPKLLYENAARYYQLPPEK